MHNNRFKSNNFTNLSEKVQKAGKRLTLDSDIILSDGDELDYITVDRNNIVIDGNNHSIDANGKAGIFKINANNVTLKNIVFKNANALDGSVIVNQTGFLHIVGCKFIDNNAEFEAGAILNLADLKIENSIFENNSANLNGGAINNKGILKAFDCRFSRNSSQKLGGAIINWKKTFIKDCTFEANSAKMDGGAINNQKGLFKVLGCEFTENTSGVSGAALINLDEFDVYNCRFDKNAADEFGGAIYNSSELRVFASGFNENRSFDGGAINNQKGAVGLVVGCEFKGNSANCDGGAINNYGTLKIENSKLAENKAGHHGGVLRTHKDSYLWIGESNEFFDNEASNLSAYAPAYVVNYCDLGSYFYNYLGVPI